MGEVKDAKRINFFMKNSLVRRVDEYAERMGTTRSAAICVLCNQALDAIEVSNNIGQVTDSVNQLQDMLASFMGSSNE